MIFAHKGYKEIDCKTDNLTWDDWVKLINDDQEYCKKLKYTKAIKKVPVSSLPSWHPYWRKVVRDNELLARRELRRKYELCIQDSSLIKVYFGLTQNLKGIIKLMKRK